MRIYQLLIKDFLDLSFDKLKASNSLLFLLNIYLYIIFRVFIIKAHATSSLWLFGDVVFLVWAKFIAKNDTDFILVTIYLLHLFIEWIELDVLLITFIWASDFVLINFDLINFLFGIKIQLLLIYQGIKMIHFKQI